MNEFVEQLILEGVAIRMDDGLLMRNLSGEMVLVAVKPVKDTPKPVRNPRTKAQE
jgi:hypothetical protein